MPRHRRTRLKSKSRRAYSGGLSRRMHIGAASFAIITSVVILGALLIQPEHDRFRSEYRDIQLRDVVLSPSKAVKVLMPSLAETETKPPQDNPSKRIITVSPDDEVPWQAFQAAHSNKDGPRIAIVIDDLGLDWKSVRRAVNLPAPVTLAFLPYAAELPAKARLAREKGHELLVHLPMSPKSKSVDPGPMVLKQGLSNSELKRRIHWNLSRFHGYVGINNHMGSAFTEDKDAMAVLFQRLRSDGLLFLDSRTTAQSYGPVLAFKNAVPYAQRDVFLDNALEATAVAEQLEKTEIRARQSGHAVAIGHPHRITLDLLLDWAKSAETRGFILVPISQIAEEGQRLDLPQLAEHGNVNPDSGGAR